MIARSFRFILLQAVRRSSTTSPVPFPSSAAVVADEDSNDDARVLEDVEDDKDRGSDDGNCIVATGAVDDAGLGRTPLFVSDVPDVANVAALNAPDIAPAAATAASSASPASRSLLARSSCLACIREMMRAASGSCNESATASCGGERAEAEEVEEGG